MWPRSWVTKPPRRLDEEPRPAVERRPTAISNEYELSNLVTNCRAVGMPRALQKNTAAFFFFFLTPFGGARRNPCPWLAANGLLEDMRQTHNWQHQLVNVALAWFLSNLQHPAPHLLAPLHFAFQVAAYFGGALTINDKAQFSGAE